MRNTSNGVNILEMTCKQEENSVILTFESSATTSDTLQNDLELVLERLNKEKIIHSKQILLFIDATNGNIFISGYDNKTSETFEEAGIWLGLQNLWEENNNAYDFDDIIITTLKKTLKTSIGTETKRNFKVYYQTEEGDAGEIK